MSKLINLFSRFSIILSASFTVMAGVTWLAARESILFIAPVVVYTFATFATFAGLAATLTFCAWRFDWLATRLAESKRDRAIANSQARLAVVDTDRQQMRLIAEGRLMAAAIRQVENGLIHPSALGDAPKFSTFPANVIKQVENSPRLIEAPARQIEFEAIARKALASRGAGRFIAFGGMDSGKTTLAKHMVSYAIEEIAENRNGQVFIIDPHAPRIVWGDNVTVVGAGMDYKTIRLFLDRVKADIKRRYEDGCGDDSVPLPQPHRPNFIICEEWTGVIAEFQAKKLWTDDDNRAFYMDARKAGWGYWLVTHEMTTKALGLDRMGNLLRGVEYFITLEKDAITGQHSAIIGNSFRDKAPYDLATPGPYNGRLYYSTTQAQAELAKKDKYLVIDAPSPAQAGAEVIAVENWPKPDPEPDQTTSDEQAIIDAVEKVRQESGKIIWMKVTSALGWAATGPNNARIKAVLDKHSISY